MIFTFAVQLLKTKKNRVMKKVLNLLAAVIFVSFLASCGGAESETETKDTTKTEETVKTESDSTKTEETVKIESDSTKTEETEKTESDSAKTE